MELILGMFLSALLFGLPAGWFLCELSFALKLDKFVAILEVRINGLASPTSGEARGLWWRLDKQKNILANGGAHHSIWRAAYIFADLRAIEEDIERVKQGVLVR